MICPRFVLLKILKGTFSACWKCLNVKGMQIFPLGLLSCVVQCSLKASIMIVVVQGLS